MKKRTLTQRILDNNYILLIISVVISISIWIYMSMNATNDTFVTISNIPVQMELSEEASSSGLRIFTANEPSASVTLTGNRTILGMVDSTDITVTASASTINTTGNFTLPVTAVKNSSSKNFSITNTAPSSVSVVVDYFKEASFPIKDGIIVNAKKGYYSSTSIPYSKVTVSGPQSEVNKIYKVVAKAEISSELSEPIDVEATIVLLDVNDNEISTQLLELSVEKFTANINVLPEKTVKVNPLFVNKPKGLKITDDIIEITPSEILIAGPSEIIDKVDFVNLDSIDFSALNNTEHVFNNLSVSVPDKCKNISNSSTATMVLDLSGFDKKTYTVTNFVVEGLPDEYSYEVTSKSVKVTVIGPAEELEELVASDITAVIDTSDATGKTGSVEMPVTFRFDGVSSCWYYGTYQANLTITEKQ